MNRLASPPRPTYAHECLNRNFNMTNELLCRHFRHQNSWLEASNFCDAAELQIGRAAVPKRPVRCPLPTAYDRPYLSCVMHRKGKAPYLSVTNSLFSTSLARTESLKKVGLMLDSLHGFISHVVPLPSTSSSWLLPCRDP